jgi:urease accessory protein
VRTGEGVAAGAALLPFLMNHIDAETQRDKEIEFNRISSASLRLCGENNWLLWQLADSAFPTGGFAHSAGLEGAWQNGEVRNRNELVSFAEAGLHQLGRAALPFVNAAHAEPERLVEFDNLCDAFTTNHVANRASRAQGKAFLVAMKRVFIAGQSPFKNSSAEKTNMEIPMHREMPVLRFSHYACVFGGAMRQLEISREIASQLFFFNHLRGVMAAAVRLNIVGPMEAQMLQRQLTPVAEEVLSRCESLTLGDIAQTSPLLDLWQGAQDRLYSRLFQS